MERLLNKNSGLRGVLGGERRHAQPLLAADNPRARLAVQRYRHRDARQLLAAYPAVLGGANAILFGGGVGEHASDVRAEILDGLDWAGVAP
ncbi:MAG: hypothetical protein U5K56_19260 [Halioglobus sp.]|nr:hypothetical protein [Halioglobus sp.]